METPKSIAEEGAKLLGIAALTKLLLDQGGECSIPADDILKVSQQYTFRVLPSIEKNELIFQVLTRERAMELLNGPEPGAN